VSLEFRRDPFPRVEAFFSRGIRIQEEVSDAAAVEKEDQITLLQ